MRTIKLFGLFCLVTISLFGCGQKNAPKSGKVTIAVIPKGTIHEYWKTVHAGAEKAGNELDVNIIWKGPLKEDDRDAQIAVVEDFISRGVSGIVLAPLDNVSLQGPVRNATRGGIPVVIFDSGLKGNDFASYVATDNFKGGQIAGEQMVKLLGGKGNVAVLRYSEGSDSTTLRENGFLDAVSKAKGIKIVSSNQYAGVTTESAYQAGENMLSRFKGTALKPGIDGIFCATEPTAFGMLRALQDANLAGKIKFIGFDSSEKLEQAMRNHQLDGVVVQNPMQIGYMGVKTMVAYLRTKNVPKRIDTGAKLITLENIDSPEVKKLLHPDLGKWLKEK